MSDWQECPNLQECTEGNRFGKGCVADNVQSAMGGKPWHECHCGVDSDGNPPNRRQADTITALRAENFSLASWQCVYIDGKTGLVGDEHGNQYCAMAKRVEALRAENERLRAALREIIADSFSVYAIEVARAALEEK